jgi:ATP-dependent exoDNAse (exonuclease V) alpha subunit
MIQVSPYTAYFTLHGIHYARQQLPIQNAFALTIHKTQGLSLNHISVSLDNTIFGPGQAYTALSRARTWEGVEIIDLNWDAFLTDQEATKEYERLALINQQMKSNLSAFNS